MTTKQQEDQQRTSQEKQGRQQLNAVIGKHVMLILGQPDNLQSVQVRPLWGDHYRVNVFVGVDATSARVAHSYFVVADDEGDVLKTTPVIQRRY
jgi:hypothetical protein